MKVEEPPIPRADATARAASPGTMRAFSRSLPMALLRAREAVMARFRPFLREHDLTEQQWRVLRALTASSTPLRASEISRLTFLSVPSLSRLLKTLEARGVIRRTVHRDDLRAALVSLSAEGRKLVAALAPLSEASYAEITAAIGARELESLYRLLDVVGERLSADEDDATGG